MWRRSLLMLGLTVAVMSANAGAAIAGGGWSVYTYNCSHPANGWQRSGNALEVDVIQAVAQQAVQRLQRSGVSYERYAAFRSTAQRVNQPAPNCGGSPPRPTCLYYVYISGSRAGSGWLGGYASDAEARRQAANFVRAYGGRWSGPTKDCR